MPNIYSEEILTETEKKTFSLKEVIVGSQNVAIATEGRI